MSDENTIQWPDEIWMAELDEHHNGQARAVLSQFGTLPRFEGCPDTDREFHRYVDGDTFDSQTAYYNTLLTNEREARGRLDAALRQKDEAMGILFDRLKSAGVDYSDLIS
tara:strand:+ start:1141 stop:1470 length:330 start_codon:yes stop_codon:yes gene_type:complete